MSLPPPYDSNPERTQDSVTIGALRRVAEPAPHGVEELGRRLLIAQGGVDAALGWLALALMQLEASQP